MSFAEKLHRKKIDGSVLQYYRRHNQSVTHDLIADHTMKVTRFQKVVVDWKETIKKDHEVNIASKEESLELMSERIRSAIERADETMKLELLAFHQKTTEKLNIVKKRQNIRKKGMLSRIFLSLYIWSGGGYNFKRVIEDVLAAK